MTGEIPELAVSVLTKLLKKGNAIAGEFDFTKRESLNCSVIGDSVSNKAEAMILISKSLLSFEEISNLNVTT